MWTFSISLGILISGLLLAYYVVVAVKPRVARPTLGEADHMRIRELEQDLMKHVRSLALDIGPRSMWDPEGLARAASYIRETWRAQGYAVHDEEYRIDGDSCANLWIEQDRAVGPDRILVVGAHYDSVAGQPGANDNASGVAALLEVSKAVRGFETACRIRFVAFVNEEPPHFASHRMGSRVHVQGSKERGEDIFAMIALETLGCYTEAQGSQKYPFPFGLLYPSTGNFLTVVGNLSSRGLVVDVLGHFMRASDLPVEGVASPGFVPGVYWSDHWSFWRAGISAVMLTDTAPFRYRHYHSPLDLPDEINARGFARAVHGIEHIVRGLASN